MPALVFVTPVGTRHTIEARTGDSVMSAAVAAGVAGIIGECGGAMACATCHVIVDSDWWSKTGGRNATEESMLEFAASEMQPHSRLSCQIRMEAALDGLVVHLPEAQL